MKRRILLVLILSAMLFGASALNPVAASRNCAYCYDILIQCLDLTGSSQCYEAYDDCLRGCF